MKNLFSVILIFTTIYLFSQTYDKRDVYKQISTTVYTTEELHDILISYKDSLEIANTLEKNENIAFYNLVISKIYYKLGSYNSSIDYSKIALTKYKEEKDTTYILLSLFNMGAIYGEITEKKIALEYFLEIEEIAMQNKDSNALAYNYVNLAMFYSTSNMELSLSYIDKAQKYIKNKNDTRFMFYSLNSKANIYYKQKKYLNAKEIFLKTFRMIDEKHFQYPNICTNLGQMYENLGMLDSSLYYNRLALDVDADSYNLKDLALVYYNLANAFVQKNETDSTKIYLDLYKRFNDSIIINKRIELVSKLKVIHETDKLVNNIKEQKLEIEKSNTRIMNMAIALFLFGIIIIIFVIYYRKLQISYKNIVKESVQAIKMEEQIASLENELNIEKEVSVKKEDINIENSDEIFNEILRLLEHEKLFTDEDFDVNKLADVLNTNRTYISKIINAKTNDSFVKFVNSYRIKEAKRMLVDESNNNLTLNAIGKMSGFKSSATFYRVFKSETGVTPSFFIKNKDA